MREDVIIRLDEKPDYYIFLRENPLWHRELTFHPENSKNFLLLISIKDI